MNRRAFFGGVTASLATCVGVPKIFGAETDDPTYIKRNGTKEWLNEHGELHRIGGPASVHVNGSEWWYLNGGLHRLDGPAVIFSNGNQFWYEHGEWIK